MSNDGLSTFSNMSLSSGLKQIVIAPVIYMELI